MKLSFGPWGETLHEFVEAGIDAEKKGFETLWTSELHRTPFVPLTALATKTSTIKLGSGVALAFLRSPLTLALTAMDLNEISNGRFILGLGSGVKNLNEYWHDVRFGKPVKHIEDVINIFMFLIKNNSASKTVSIFFLIPPTTAIMAWLFLNEKLDNLDLIGFAIATLGVYIATRK